MRHSWNVSTLQLFFVSNVTVILGVFFVVLDKKMELSSCFIEANSKIGKKIKYLQAKQREGVRTCKDCVIGRETTTILKIAMDNVILELCDSCDYFASPLLMKKN